MNNTSNNNRPFWRDIVTDIPFWQSDEANCYLIVGNKTVATLLPVKHKTYQWIALLAPEYQHDGWHAADFESLDMAQIDIMEWWLHRCRGEEYHL